MRNLNTKLFVVEITYENGEVKYVGQRGWYPKLHDAKFYKKKGMAQREADWINSARECYAEPYHAEPVEIHLFDTRDA